MTCLTNGLQEPILLCYPIFTSIASLKLQIISAVACANSNKSHLSPTLTFIIYRLNTMQDNNRYNKPTQTELSAFSSVGEHCYGTSNELVIFYEHSHTENIAFLLYVSCFPI